MSEMPGTNAPKIRNGSLGYLHPIRLLKLNPYPYVACIILSAFFESAIMAALYPVITIGLNEKHPFLDQWIEFLHQFGLETPQIVILQLAAFVAFGTLSSLTRWGGESGIESFRGSIERNARRTLVRSLQDIRWSNYIKLGSGKSIHLLATSSDRMAQGVRDFLMCLGSGSSGGVMFCALIVISPVFASTTIAVFILGYFVQKKLGRKSSRSVQEYGSESVELGSGYAYLMQNLKYCRSSGYDEAISNKLGLSTEVSATAYGETHKIFAQQRVLLDFCAFLAIATVFFTVISFQFITFSKASIFLGILYRLIPKLVGANYFWQLSSANLPFLHLWQSAYDAAFAAPAAKFGKAEIKFGRDICFKNVSFRHDGTDKDVLTHLNLRIEKNTFFAIVGESGSGKSTLFDLLTGLVSPTQGAILIDGVDLNDISIKGWRSQIGIVPQDVPIINGTVLENIAFMDKTPDREWAMECARLANAGEFIDRLASGIDSIIDEKLSFSGGESQRLSLARALYRRPAVLLLDEPTSALDRIAEEKFIECLHKISGQVTILMSTHRLSTIALATDILVLKRGEIAELSKTNDLAVKLIG